MEAKDLLKEFSNHRQIKEFDKALNGASSVWLRGVAGSMRSVVFASVTKDRDEDFIIIMDDIDDAAYLYNDLVQLLGNDFVLFFPSAYKQAIKYGRKDAANEILRTEVLSAINVEKNKSHIVVTYPEALAEKVISSDGLGAKMLNVHKGEKLDMDFVISTLEEYGFQRTDFVYEPGQYSVRGSLIDIFSFSHEYPYRLDFFGDEVESIRTFDIETQLSKEPKDEVPIISNIHEEVDTQVSIFKFIPQNTILCFNDYNYCLEIISKTFSSIEDNDSLIDEVEAKSQIDKFIRVEFGLHNSGTSSLSIDFKTENQPLFHKNLDMLCEHFKEQLEAGYKIYVLSDSERQTERLKDIFDDKASGISFTPILHTLHDGFLDQELKICCYTDHQIFDRYHKYSLRSDKAKEGNVALTLKELNNFKIGDYVVHIDHGVGRFGGLITQEQNGKKQEMIKLLYRDDDLLFVSIHSLHKISRYKSKDGEPPHINKLGTGAWQTLKERTKKKVKDIARELILLYSKRKSEKGYQFSPDSFLQNELEASFIYEDTPDQAKATADVKRDMERPLPMDRLVCGDVGFGKTEVAIRAAFKAVTDNKQVAVLVPTTVLALQHYKTFSERLKAFPCKVDYLSRARSAKDIKAITKALELGEINIIIGTHKLISKSIKFKDLGLLIVDEEQKFGVSVKEKIRQMKVNIDTLTLTATPIPRTLQFSLMGARDLSVMRTPPSNRYPVHTELHTFNEDVIREAINYELGRNGQVFFVNNRIQNLEEIRTLIKRLVPDARVAIGHGRMEGEEMEKIILDFLDYEYDVLVATSIIESGIDIANCNTIIINNAHNFGLSDLHQLRGRVGRSNRRAFCYLLAPPLSSISQDSRRRLQAIENFAGLGSGFSIAMQDLDIRGAGNLLGAEQSGFIADLGYETYQKVLNEAVHELKTDEFAQLYANEQSGSGEATFVSDCQMETDLELMFPDDYVSNVSERMNLYRELDNIHTDKELEEYEKRLEDRFGKIPEQTRDLILLVRLRWVAIRLGFEKIILKNNRLSCYFVQADDSPYFQSQSFGKILFYLQNHPKKCNLRDISGKRSIVFSPIEKVSKALDTLIDVEEGR